jgi:ketosteroid isomerase-like protein
VPPGRTYGNHGGATDDVEAVRAIYDAFSRQDVEAALAYVSEDMEFDPAGTRALIGRSDPYRGHDGIREYFADAGRAWEELTLRADDVRAAAGGVVVFGHAEGRVRGERIRRRVVWTWKLRDGKAISMRASDLGDARGDA